MSGGTLRDRLNGFLGQPDPEAERASSGGGSLRDRLNSFRQPQVGVTLEGLDAEAAAAAQGGGVHGTIESPEADTSWEQNYKPEPRPFTNAALAASEGVLNGLGMRPEMVGGEQAALRAQSAHLENPKTAAVAHYAGEVGGQMLAAPAKLLRSPTAMGAVSGFLSGVGNTAGSAWEKAKAGFGGAAGGAWGGGMLGGGSGKMAALLEKKGPQWAEDQATHGMMRGGATPADLAEADARGGRVAEYRARQRLGIAGDPRHAQELAREALGGAQAVRENVVAQNPGVQIDPQAMAAGVRGANPYPGVARFDKAADRAAQEIASAGQRIPSNVESPNPALDRHAGYGLSPAQLDVQRAYRGDGTNFASGTPSAKLGKGIHTAINNEVEDAYNLAQPGTAHQPGGGTQYRQAGSDMNTAIEAEQQATRAKDQATAKDWSLADMASGGSLRVLNANRHGISERGYGAASDIAGGLSPLLRGGQMAGGAFGGDIAGGAASDATRSEARQLTEQALTDLQAGGNTLGKYKKQIAEAAGSPAPGALGALLTRLTMTDADFRMNVLPQLRGR